MSEKIKIVIAISGASGMIYAKNLIEKLNLPYIKSQVSEIAIIFSSTAKHIWEDEIGVLDKSNLGFPVFSNNSFYVPFASGSATYDILIIVPCSMGTLGRIAGGISDSLITRTADVLLKERKRIILLTRETPLSLIHINNMKTVTEAGGIICPANPSFYHKPNSINDLINTVVDRLLDLSGIKVNSKRWKTE